MAFTSDRSGYDTYGYGDATSVAARRNLAPAPAPAATPAPLRNVTKQRETTPRTVEAAVESAAATVSTASHTDAQGPAPGSTNGGAAPPSESAASMTLATLPPAARTLLKVAPFVAAAYFWHKGDHTLAAVSAAAGGAAFVML